ncbi:hypothetical protein ATCC90586_001248 [Pythium insidiosum]|nr:hypothetical protein ATCC90586_001248 [Pythium insidiosum]
MDEQELAGSTEPPEATAAAAAAAAAAVTPLNSSASLLHAADAGNTLVQQRRRSSRSLADMTTRLARQHNSNVNEDDHDDDDDARERRSADGSDAPRDDVSTFDELQVFLRRSHHSLPFLALFLVYFAYQHTTGILVFAVGSVAIVGLDQRVRAQVALKEQASGLHLVAIVAMCLVDMVALCAIGGDPNPLHHIGRKLSVHDKDSSDLFLDVVWLVIVSDFIVRLTSLSIKAAVAAVKSEKWLGCGRRRGSHVAVARDELQAESSPIADSPHHPKPARSTTAFYRRKRKLYGIIELLSIFLRTLLASIPWCSYYQLCSSKFMGDVFTFSYIFIKGLVLGNQGRRILQLVQSFLTLGLEHATYVSREELVESGNPDCSICYEPMHYPVKLACSHMFCEECVMEWFDRERSCPLCRASVLTTAPPSPGDAASIHSPTAPVTSSEDVKPQFFDGSTSLFPQLL